MKGEGWSGIEEGRRDKENEEEGGGEWKGIVSKKMK